MQFKELMDSETHAALKGPVPAGFLERSVESISWNEFHYAYKRCRLHLSKSVADEFFRGLVDRAAFFFYMGRIPRCQFADYEIAMEPLREEDFRVILSKFNILERKMIAVGVCLKLPIQDLIHLTWEKFFHPQIRSNNLIRQIIDSQTRMIRCPYVFYISSGEEIHPHTYFEGVFMRRSDLSWNLFLDRLNGISEPSFAEVCFDTIFSSSPNKSELSPT